MGILWKKQLSGEYSCKFEVEGGEVYATQPDVVKYPGDVQKLVAAVEGKVTSVATMDVKCPNCSSRSDKRVVFTEHEVAVICCPDCAQYVWVKDSK